MAPREELFSEVTSTDFLSFAFNDRSYNDQLLESMQKTQQTSAVSVTVRDLDGTQVVWAEHNFGFMGGSLGCAEGEKITLAFEHATDLGLPIVVQTRTGGARMQEGTMSLMQMAKVSVAVEAHRRAKLPFISVLLDPTYGGVPASYAMQADVKVAITGARIGFAGPSVILNTMFEMDQGKFDSECPAQFQSSDYLKEHGQLDLVVEDEAALATALSTLAKLLSPKTAVPLPPKLPAFAPATAAEREAVPDYARSRHIARPQAKDVIDTLFTDFTELCGDGRVAADRCIKGGVAMYGGRPVVVVGQFKGHTAGDMAATNYGMPAPAGYRTALRLFKLAETFGMPVVTLVDTCGAWPSFEAERDGQSEAIATNLTAQASLTVPIVTLVLGEGGSGGALGIAMGNEVGMMSQAYYGVISPEGAASILGRYDDDAHKASQFPKDCQELATAQHIYAYQLEKLGVVDNIVYEKDGETHTAFPVTAARIGDFLTEALDRLGKLDGKQLVEQRYQRYRKLGRFEALAEADRAALLAKADAVELKKRDRSKKDVSPSKLATWLGEQLVASEYSRAKGLAPASVPLDAPFPPVTEAPAAVETAKNVLDRDGPEAMAKWVRAKKQVLITDTTMRDAHQSLLATRCRTQDLVKGAAAAAAVLPNAFSFECWGGATFDVAYRFLHEDPWDRLREIRKAAPNTCTQMLIRGANAVGYTSYPDNVVEEFVALSAKNGLDVFRIFDCFNDLRQMEVTIKAVRKANKVAEVCICYTGDITTSDVYDLKYYKDLAKTCADAGAHMIGIKDMAGLLKPRSAKPLVDAIREGCDLPIHFHTHATSSASLATALEMSKAGCDVIDFAIASMADLTSQPSLNAFCASMAGDERHPDIDFMALEPLDLYWMRVRDMYAPFENGLKAGSARVFDHEIPGGQYANLLVQCKSMGIYDKWGEVLDMYRDVNTLFGNVVKVTPSSKCVGDLALYLVTRSLSTADVLDPVKGASIEYPDSVLGLMEGRLGFPHRGFPKEVVRAILKDAPQLVTRPSDALAPADFGAEKAKLVAAWGADGIDDERVMASLLYPKVFDDHKKHEAANSRLARYLPTPVFFYGLELGQTVTLENVPADLAREELGVEAEAGNATVDVPVTLKRIGPLKKGSVRTIVYVIGGREQHVKVKDAQGDDAFDGEYADADDANHVGAPMPGVVEGFSAKAGQVVEEGDELAVVCAMKMEIKVKAPHAGKVSRTLVQLGDKVVEGALLVVVEPL